MSAPRESNSENNRMAVLETAREDASFLAKASAPVPMGMDLNLALSNWARLSVPYLADWCLIDLVIPDGTLKRMGVAYRFSEGERQLPLLRAELPVPALSAQLQRLLEEKKPLMEDPANPEGLASHFSAIAPTGILAVPLQIAGRSAGLITWLMAGSGRAFTRDRLGIAEEFAARVASSLSNLNAYRLSQIAVQAREEFISVASHELKTPLTVLVLQLEMMRRGLPPEDDGMISVQPFRKGIAAVQEATDRLRETIHRLLDLNQIRAGQLRLSCFPLDLRDIVGDVARSLKPALASAGCELRMDLGEKAMGSWDAFRMSQVLSNLITNAIKYAPGSPITVTLIRSNDCAIVSVEDQGKGIPFSDQDTLFDAYSRAKGAQKASGMGLGLYICRNIVELHGGRIWVESSEGKGSKFSIQLPIEH